MAEKRSKKVTDPSAAPSPDVQARAGEIVATYRLSLVPEPQGGGFVGSSLDLPTILGHGQTAEECLADTRRALLAAVVHMIEQGDRPPERSHRIAQINIRVTPDEKETLTEGARNLRYHSVSDFLRQLGLDHIANR